MKISTWGITLIISGEKLCNILIGYYPIEIDSNPHYNPIMNTLSQSHKVIAGLWIDHRKAVIVVHSPKEKKTIEILSHVEKHPSREEGSGSSNAHESNHILADNRHQQKYTQELNRYYAEIATTLQEAQSILIFGPGEAKGELKKHLEEQSHDQKKIVVETTDKMTDRQISAKIHEHFQTRS